MAYILNKSNGAQLTILNDGVTDNLLTSLTLVGKNVSNFGEAQNQNFIRMLENFANSSAVGGQPRSPITGQIWFDTNALVNRPLVFDGASWRPIAISIYDTTTTNSIINSASNPNYPFSATKPGDFWVDSANKQLYIVTNTLSEVTLIGPEQVAGFGATRMISTKMFDINGIGYPVIQTVLNGEVISIHSTATFDTTTTNQVSGFPKVYRGLTFKNYNTSTRYSTSTNDTVIYGLHDQLDTSYPRKNQNEHIQGSWYIDTGSQLNFGTSSESNIAWNNGLFLSSTGTFKISANGNILIFDGYALTATSTLTNLGSVTSPFQYVYASNITGTTISALNMYQNGYRVLTAENLATAGVVNVQGTPNNVVAITSSGVVTLSLPNVVNIPTINVTTITATNVIGNNITDSGARVITTATLPFSISTVSGVSNQITVNITDRTATIGLATNLVITNVTATNIYGSNIYQNGARVITTATLPLFSVVGIQGTSNQITATNVNGVVTIALTDTVGINRLTANSATIGNFVATTSTISALQVSSAVATSISSTNANISSQFTASSANITNLSVGNNATIANNLTSTNIYASSSMIGYNVRGTFGDFSNQLNATNASINTLTVTVLKDSLGTSISKIDKDGTMAANSDLNLATQKAIVSYVQSVISSIIIPDPVPSGTIFDSAASSPPSGYLVCDGSSKSTATYSTLFAVIGYTYGGSGSTFKLPDLRNSSASGGNSNGYWKLLSDFNGGTYLVQYGITPGVLSQGPLTITFPEPFLDTSYDLQLTAVIPSQGNYDNYPQEISGTRTTSSVQIFVHDGASNITGIRWRAEGPANASSSTQSVPKNVPLLPIIKI